MEPPPAPPLTGHRPQEKGEQEGVLHLLTAERRHSEVRPLHHLPGSLLQPTASHSAKGQKFGCRRLSSLSAESPVVNIKVSAFWGIWGVGGLSL